MSTDTKSGEVVSALVTTAISCAVLSQGSGVHSFDSTGMTTQWAAMALFCSIAYIASMIFRLEVLRSIARFWSGVSWGTVVLACVAATNVPSIFWCAVALFGFDFYAVFKGEKWQRSNCSASSAIG